MSNPGLLSPEATDALLDQVSEQITFDTFDATDETLLKQLVECLGDSRGIVRLRCAETLGEIGEATTPFLIEALAHHPNVVVRRAAAKTITLIADPATIPTLVHALFHDEDTVVKGSSVGALARMGEASVPILLDILASPEHPESMKGHAAWALAFIGIEAKDYLYTAISSDSPEVRGAVVGAIAKVAQEEPKADLFEILIHALDDPDGNVRCEAAAALGNLSHEPAIPKLTELLSHHPDWETRKAAALSLMKVGQKSSIEPLQQALLQEKDDGVKSIIKLAISQLERQVSEDSWG